MLRPSFQAFHPLEAGLRAVIPHRKWRIPRADVMTNRGRAVAVGHEVEKGSATPRTRAQAKKKTANGNGDGAVTRAELEQLLAAMAAARDGDFHSRLPVRGKGLAAELNRAFNELADRRQSLSAEISRVGR